MAKRSLGPLMLAALLVSVVPAWSQRGPAAPVSLPEGNGKAVVETRCSQCHGLNLITNSWGYTRDGWENMFKSMVALPKEEAASVADYLGKNFPEKDRPKAVLLKGETQVGIKEWLVPSLGSRPHDPLSTPDGAL